MFRTVLGINMYAVIQGVDVALFALLTLHLLRAGKVRAIHVVGLTLLYAFCNFTAGKFLFDVLVSDKPFRLHNYVSISHYFEGGYWGWATLFLPLVLLYPILLRCDRLAVYRSIALTLPPVIAVQKLACLSVGCCGGMPTDLPWGVVFNADSQCPTPGVPVHPVQYYDMLAALLAWAALTWADRRPRWRPYLYPLFVAFWALDLLITGFFRADTHGFMSMRQALGGGALMAVVLLLVFGRTFWDRFADRERSALVTG